MPQFAIAARVPAVQSQPTSAPPKSPITTPQPATFSASPTRTRASCPFVAPTALRTRNSRLRESKDATSIATNPSEMTRMKTNGTFAIDPMISTPCASVPSATSSLECSRTAFSSISSVIIPNASTISRSTMRPASNAPCAAKNSGS